MACPTSKTRVCRYESKGRTDNFRVARHSLITNSFAPQLIEVFLQTATTADHHLISDGEQRNRLSD